MCFAGDYAGAGVEYLTGFGLGVSGDSGTGCLWFLQMMAVGVCTAYPLIHEENLDKIFIT